MLRAVERSVHDQCNPSSDVRVGSFLADTKKEFDYVKVLPGLEPGLAEPPSGSAAITATIQDRCHVETVHIYCQQICSQLDQVSDAHTAMSTLRPQLRQFQADSLTCVQLSHRPRNCAVQYRNPRSPR
jgi:hypothetical protein